MTDGEKMVWAAAFAGVMAHDFDSDKAASHAEDCVVELRGFVSRERALRDFDSLNYKEPSHLSMTKEMINE